VETRRLEGNDRYGTALAIAREVGPVERDTFEHTAFIVSGTNYPDALAISPLAAAEGVPILPVKGTVVPAAIQTALEELEIEHCVIMGDTGVVSTTVEGWLESNGYRVNGVAPGAASVDTRLGGANRYDTTLLAVGFSAQMGDFDDSTTYIATGTNWPDALALAPLAGMGRHPLVLINGAEIGKSVSVAEYLVDHQADPPTVAFVGGDGAISPYVRGQVRVALGQ
jgi:putative cell wall-binding protein